MQGFDRLGQVLLRSSDTSFQSSMVSSSKLSNPLSGHVELFSKGPLNTRISSENIFRQVRLGFGGLGQVSIGSVGFQYVKLGQVDQVRLVLKTRVSSSKPSLIHLPNTRISSVKDLQTRGSLQKISYSRLGWVLVCQVKFRQVRLDFSMIDQVRLMRLGQSSRRFPSSKPSLGQSTFRTRGSLQ